MTIGHHPHEVTLMAYTAGTLAPALSALVVCHLSVCPKCRDEVRHMEFIGGALLECVQGAELSEKTFDSALTRLAGQGLAPNGEQPLSPAPRPFMRFAYRPAETPVRPQASKAKHVRGALPEPLARYLGKEIDEIPWKRLVEGVEKFQIRMPWRGGNLRLLRVQPGLKLLRHTHRGCELTMVIKGAFCDETGVYREGEVADLDMEIEHTPQVSGDEECICIVACERPPRYSHLGARLLRPLLGI